jgi:hypothetical protein
MVREAAIKQAICHNCKEDMSSDIYVRSYEWAFGMMGVRWALCSKRCAQELRDSGVDKFVAVET